MRGKGRQMNNDCTCFLLLAVQAEEPVTYPFYTSPPPQFPSISYLSSASTCEIRHPSVPVKK